MFKLRPKGTGQIASAGQVDAIFFSKTATSKIQETTAAAEEEEASKQKRHTHNNEESS